MNCAVTVFVEFFNIGQKNGIKVNSALFFAKSGVVGSSEIQL